MQVGQDSGECTCIDGVAWGESQHGHLYDLWNACEFGGGAGGKD